MFRTLNRRYKTSTGSLYTYDNILLTVYLEIAHTGNTGLLVIKGNYSDQQLQTAWEEIVRQNANTNGSGGNDQLDNIKDYVRLLATYTSVRAALLQLCLVVDDECISFLESKGYKIDGSSNTKYLDSINAALHKVKNVLTKLTSRYKVITEAMKDDKPDVPIHTSAETLIANVSAAMGFNVDSSVTLARFNEYNKIIKKRIENQKMRTKAA